ncbi:UNVERIFIED_CONTAM: hypothetical protein FKN15_042420 [Acipenser sinensis]
MDRNALAELLQALESRRDAEERRREERYTALIERVGLAMAAATTPTTTPFVLISTGVGIASVAHRGADFSSCWTTCPCSSGTRSLYDIFIFSN